MSHLNLNPIFADINALSEQSSAESTQRDLGRHRECLTDRTKIGSKNPNSLK